MRFAVYARAHGKGLEVPEGVCPYVVILDSGKLSQNWGYANQNLLFYFFLIRLIFNYPNYLLLVI